MATLKDRLLYIEEDFIAALTQGEKSLCAFEERWEALLQDVDQVVQSTGLDDDVAPLVHSTAMRIAVLAETSSDLYETTAALTSQLVEELDGMMSELSIHEPHSLRSPDCLRSPSSRPVCGQSDYTSPRRKRSRSSSDERGVPGSKRLRTATYPQDDKCDYSSAASLHAPLSPLSPTPNHFLSPVDHFPISLKRKRHVSEADTSPPTSAKRLYVGPRLHAVSDSYRPRRTSTVPSSTIIPDPVDIPAVSPTQPQLPRISAAFENTGTTGLPSGPLDIDKLLNDMWDGKSLSEGLFLESVVFDDLPDSSWYPSYYPSGFLPDSPASILSSTSSPSCPSTPSDRPSLSLDPSTTFRLLDPNPEDNGQELYLSSLSDAFSYQSPSPSACGVSLDEASTSFKAAVTEDPWVSLLHLLEPLRYRPDVGDCCGSPPDSFTCFNPNAVDGVLLQDSLLTSTLSSSGSSAAAHDAS